MGAVVQVWLEAFGIRSRSCAASAAVIVDETPGYTADTDKITWLPSCNETAVTEPICTRTN